MNNPIQDKLYNYQEQPSEKVWQAIEEALDTPIELQEKLYKYQETPPAGIWENIMAALDEKGEETVAPVIPQRTSKPLIKYIAAASVLLIVAFSAVWISNRNAEQKNIVQNVMNKNQRSGTTQQIQPQIQTTEPAKEEIRQNTSVVVNDNREHTLAKKENHKKTFKISATKTADIEAPPKPSVQHPQESAIVQARNEDKYMIYSTDSGNVVKLPKKLYTVFSCATDPDISQALWCKQNLQYMQRKAAQATPPSTDFAAMLYMIKDLQENQ
ncbi:MAG: anti-sigma factor [Chitinophagaceae bacterium]|nr:anti-sigma factor [Chitinophagaceae bacterium]